MVFLKVAACDLLLKLDVRGANAAFELFVKTYGVKYEHAVNKLTKDRNVLLTLYEFPAEHWKHIRTTNP